MLKGLTKSLLAATFLMGSAAAVAAQDFTIRATANSNEADEDYDGLVVFKNYVENASNGRIAVERIVKNRGPGRREVHAELVRAARMLAEEVQAGRLTPEAITEDEFRARLFTAACTNSHTHLWRGFSTRRSDD